MERDKWELFLRSKTKLQRYNYKQRRTCASCSVPITDKAKSSYCRKCVGQSGSGNGSIKHKQLQARALIYLQNLGCNDAQIERVIGESWNSRRQGTITADVAGYLGGKLITIECGGLGRKVRFRRYGRLLSSGDIAVIFVWPYNAVEPYIWQPDLEICPTCGNKV